MERRRPRARRSRRHTSRRDGRVDRSDAAIVCSLRPETDAARMRSASAPASACPSPSMRARRVDVAAVRFARDRAQGVVSLRAAHERRRQPDLVVRVRQGRVHRGLRSPGGRCDPAISVVRFRRRTLVRGSARAFSARRSSRAAVGLQTCGERQHLGEQCRDPRGARLQRIVEAVRGEHPVGERCPSCDRPRGEWSENTVARRRVSASRKACALSRSPNTSIAASNASSPIAMSCSPTIRRISVPCH